MKTRKPNSTELKFVEKNNDIIIYRILKNGKTVPVKAKYTIIDKQRYNKTQLIMKYMGLSPVEQIRYFYKEYEDLTEVKGYPGYYMTQSGKIYSTFKNKAIKLLNGYVKTTEDGKQFKRYNLMVDNVHKCVEFNSLYKKTFGKKPVNISG